MNDPMALFTGIAVAACAALVVWLAAQMATTDEKALVLATLGACLVAAVLTLLGGLLATRPPRRG